MAQARRLNPRNVSEADVVVLATGHKLSLLGDVGMSESEATPKGNPK